MQLRCDGCRFWFEPRLMVGQQGKWLCSECARRESTRSGPPPKLPEGDRVEESRLSCGA